MKLRTIFTPFSYHWICKETYEISFSALSLSIRKYKSIHHDSMLFTFEYLSVVFFKCCVIGENEYAEAISEACDTRSTYSSLNFWEYYKILPGTFLKCFPAEVKNIFCHSISVFNFLENKKISYRIR